MNTPFFAQLVERALPWIVLLPLAGAVINGAFGRFADRRLVGRVAVGTVAGSFLLSVMVFGHLVSLHGSGGGQVVSELYQWFTVSIGRADVPIRIAFVADSLSGIMLLVVTGIGLLIHVYSLEYMHEDPGFPRFFAYLNLFMASMLVLVLGSSLPVMFIGWEGVGLCSYLLIGFWFTTPAYAAAGKKAFVMNRIGDLGVLLGTFVIASVVQSFEFADIADRVGALSGPFYLGRTEIGATVTVAALLLFLGCTGKSAQIPLFTWLPDAMAGPTPVSALIHAATMVTAGVYLCCRMSAVFLASPTAMAVIAIVGALTALLAASIALVQNQMKRILAYSTVSQLGFMFAAVGCGAFAAGIFHVFTHAFFKACLFLGAGAVMHAVHAHGDADVRRLGGLRERLPTVHWTFLASCLAIAGVPLFSGFFSKDEILLGALQATHYLPSAGIAWFVFAVLVVAATMTAFYMFRMYFLAFHGEYRSAAQDTKDAYAAEPHRPGWAISFVLSVLAVGAVVVGYVGLPHAFHLPNLWAEWLHDDLASAAHGHSEASSAPALAMGFGTLAMAVGIGLAWWIYRQQGAMPRAQSEGLHRVLMGRWYVDELYDRVIVGPIRQLATVSAAIDKYAVDGLLTRLTAVVVRAGAWLFTRIQTGLVYAYGAVMVAGVIGLAWWFAYPHPGLSGVAEGEQVTWTAGRGLGYQYRWDVDGDGQFDGEWDPSRFALSRSYDAGDVRGYVVVVQDDRRGPVKRYPIDEQRPLVLEEAMVGALGSGGPADDGPRPAAPTVRVKDGRVTVHPGAARLVLNGSLVERETEIKTGDSLRTALSTLRLAAVLHMSVEVKNAFGNVQSQTAEVLMGDEPSTPETGTIRVANREPHPRARPQ